VEERGKVTEYERGDVREERGGRERELDRGSRGRGRERKEEKGTERYSEGVREGRVGGKQRHSKE